MTKGFQGFHVDQIAAHDRELLTKHANFVQCEQRGPEANHRYIITILHGRRNREHCHLVPPDPTPSIQYYIGNPPRPIVSPGEREQPGLLRTCRILDNGVHVHQYGKQGGEYTLRMIENVGQERQIGPDEHAF